MELEVREQDFQNSDPIEMSNDTPIQQDDLMETCHNRKVSRVLERWTREDFVLFLANEELHTTKYDEAISDTDAEKWHKAMKVEIDSMYVN